MPEYKKWKRDSSHEKGGYYVESCVYHKETGEKHACWPVDARELVKGGEYQNEKPEPKAVKVAAPVEEPAPESPSEPPAAPPKIRRKPGPKPKARPQ